MSIEDCLGDCLGGTLNHYRQLAKKMKAIEDTQWILASASFHSKHGLPSRDKKRGRPVSTNPTRYGVDGLPAREMDILDCLVLYFRMAKDSDLPPNLVVDLSQALRREA